MADYRYQTQAPGQVGARAEIDQGLRSYMLGVYNYMALGIAATAIIALAVASSPAAMATVYSLKWVFFIGIIAMGFLAPRMIFSGNPAMAHAAYWGYVALWGLGIAPMVVRQLERSLSPTSAAAPTGALPLAPPSAGFAMAQPAASPGMPLSQPLQLAPSTSGVSMPAAAPLRHPEAA